MAFARRCILRTRILASHRGISCEEPYQYLDAMCACRLSMRWVGDVPNFPLSAAVEAFDAHPELHPLMGTPVEA